MGFYIHCGIKNLSICATDLENSGNVEVEWKAFEYKYLDKKGKIVSKAKIAEMRSTQAQENPGKTIFLLHIH